MNVTIKGVIKSISDKQQVSDKFCKQEMVITIDETTPYPKPVQVEFKQDKCDLTGKLNEGDNITVECNIDGREWVNNGVTKVFNSFPVWKITEHTPNVSNNNSF